MYAEDYTGEDVNTIFNKLLQGNELSKIEITQFKSAVLYELALLDHEKGWVQQWHIGGLRNTNSRLLKEVGTDAGVDSIGDFSTAKSMSKFFNKLDSTQQLSKTVVYNLNPADNEVYATMMGNFQDGNVPGKMQYGSAWWFSDQKEGMEKQMNALANIGLLSRFIGMTTDSRSFLSFPRHEYFRRILCNLFGEDIEKGELPNDIQLIGNIIQDICYHNANNYFNWTKGRTNKKNIT
jgi:glucuronate isomerase